jgi:hypothetical protein
MKTGAGLALIAVGAILAFAVNSTPSGFNINIAGWVLMIVGVIGLLLPMRTYGWINQRVVRRRYSTNAAPPPQAPVQGYVAQNPGNSRLQPGLPAPRQAVVEDDDLIDRPYQRVNGTQRPTTEVVEDVYEEPS